VILSGIHAKVAFKDKCAFERPKKLTRMENLTKLALTEWNGAPLAIWILLSITVLAFSVISLSEVIKFKIFGGHFEFKRKPPPKRKPERLMVSIRRILQTDSKKARHAARDTKKHRGRISKDAQAQVPNNLEDRWRKLLSMSILGRHLLFFLNSLRILAYSLGIRI
jgi:hypothetical protein